MISNKQFDYIFFDFGNVIINIDFELTYRAFDQLLGSQSTKVMAQWAEQKFHQKIETEPYTALEMADVLNGFGAQLTAEQVKYAWNALLLDIPPKRIELLEKLSKQYPLFLLSNTNLVHIDHIFSNLEKQYGTNPLTPLFNKMYLSYEIGHIKPNIGIYQYVIDDLNVDPAKCIFFDDLQENLDGAAQLGFQTQLVTKEQGILELFDYKYSTESK